MELTINVPYVEHVGRAAKRVHGKVTATVTKRMAQTVMDSERGRQMILAIMAQGLENRERSKNDDTSEV